MNAKPARFVWPPRAAPAASAPSPGPPQAPEIRVGANSAWSQIERVWLGRTRAPLAERMADAGWSPDDDFAYCPRCASSAGPHEADDTGCSWCRGQDLPWSRTVRLGEYRGVLRDMVLDVKFTRWRRLGHDLGRLLGGALRASLDRAGIPPRLALLVPVPMPFRRWIMSGVDHALVICRGVAAESGVRMINPISRVYRPSQLEVAPSRRFANAAGSFRVRPGPLAVERGVTLVLVDDVRTTGATLIGACRAARRHPALEGAVSATWCAVLGVTPDKDRSLAR